MGDAAADELVVVCGTTPWDGVTSARRKVAVPLSAHRPVLFVDPPVSPLTSLRSTLHRRTLAHTKLNKVADRIWRLQPVVTPGKDRPGLRRLADRGLNRAIRSAVESLGLPVAAVVAALPTRPVFDAVEARVRCYWITDDHVAGARLYGLNPDVVDAGERWLSDRADVLLGASEDLVDRWRGRGHPNVQHFPNGADVELFSRAGQSIPQDFPPVPAGASGTVGFVGVMCDRIHVPLLRAVADKGVHVMLIGPRRSSYDDPEFDALLEHPLVSWLGPRKPDELPAYLHAFDVGLIPYAMTAYNHASSPLKLYEYLAAGLPVVTTPIAPFRELGPPLATLAEDPELFAKAALDAMGTRSDSAAVRARRDFAAANSWTSRAAALADALQLTGQPAPH